MLKFSAFFSRRTLSALLILCLCLVSIVMISGMAETAYSAEKPGIPSIGSGRYELYIFTDYFCGPCQTLEKELDPALRELVDRKAAKIKFIDIPIHSQTALYNRYFLYAAYADSSARNILLARQELFALAQRDASADEKKIAGLFKNRNIPYKAYDLKMVYPEFNRIIKQFNIRSTPTCVVKYSARDIRTYSGISQIRNGLAVLRAAVVKSR